MYSRSSSLQPADQWQEDRRTDTEVVLGVPGKARAFLVALAGDVEAVPLQTVKVKVMWEIPSTLLVLQRSTRVAGVSLTEEFTVRHHAHGFATVARVYMGETEVIMLTNVAVKVCGW